MPLLVLGAGLDGAPAPIGLPPLTATAGPFGFMDLLGQWVGIDTKLPAEAERIAAMLAALREMKGRFWSTSYDVDPWATSRRVLAMRDALLIAGWDGSAPANAPPRVRDLADLPPVPPGLPDTLRGLAVMALPRYLPEVALLEPIALWPPLWRRLLGRLNAVSYSIPPVSASGDLGALQNWFSTSRQTVWTGDGSLTLLTGDRGADCADVVSALLPFLPPDSVLLGADAPPLPLFSRARHLPGAAAVTGATPGIQLLSLALALHWEPFDAAAALEFLQLPAHPLGGAARFLIDAISNHPGHGGRLYRQAVAAARQAALNAEGYTPQQREKRAQARVQAIAAWLPETRHTPADGLPAATVQSVCRSVIAWATAEQRLQDAAPAAALDRAVAQSGVERFSPILLGRMLESVSASDVVLVRPEAAPWRSFADPAARLDPADAGLWWLGPMPSASASPWRQAEQSWMRQHRMEPDDALAPYRARLALSRAITLFRERLILVSPRDGGEEGQPHPLLGLLSGCFGASLRGAWSEAQDLQTGGIIGGIALPAETLPATTPPVPRRDWQVGRGLIGSREVESPSGLEKLLGCPLAWVLSYKARLYSRGPAALPDAERIVGTLAHEVIHGVFQAGYTSPADAASKAQALFENLVPEMAAPLLRPENGRLYGRARVDITQAVGDLAARLGAAGLSLDGSERTFNRALPGEPGQLEGRLDLLFAGRNGKVVLDVKWTRNAKGYTRRLAENRPLQLAAYAWLVGPDTRAAYYLLRQRRLLAADPEPFANGHVAGADLSACWQGAMQDFTLALKALRAGRIVAAGVDPPETDDRQLPIEAPCRFCGYSGLCGAGS